MEGRFASTDPFSHGKDVAINHYACGQFGEEDQIARLDNTVFRYGSL